jgi:hypothetical protein
MDIYKGTPDLSILQNCVNDLDKGVIPEGIFNIPYSYIKSIENHIENKIIKIEYGQDSEEIIRVKEDQSKQEIFNLLKSKLSNSEHLTKTPTIFKHAKPQILAMLIMTGLFIWTLYLAIQIEMGYEYEIVGGKAGITSIVLMLALFGVLKVILGYTFIMAIAIYSFIRKLKTRSLVEYLIRY